MAEEAGFELAARARACRVLLAEEKGPEVDQGGLEIRRPFSRETSGSNPSLRQRTLSPEAKLKTAS